MNSTRKYCFGLEDTIKFLHAGVIDTLVCWENLDIGRLVVRNPETELTTALYLNSEQRRDSSLFRSEDKVRLLDAQPCECKN